MRINKINIYKVTLPFRGEFAHSRNRGLLSKNVIVELKTDAGINGYGEGVPRDYATGETLEQVIQKFNPRYHTEIFPWDCNDFNTINQFIKRFQKNKTSPSICCAFELALLDVLGKTEKKSILDYFNDGQTTNRIRYGAAITIGRKEKIRNMCEAIKYFGIKDIRVKMCGDANINANTLEIVRNLIGDDCDIRIDPNGIWDREIAFEHLSLIKDYNVSVVEEPFDRDQPGFIEFSDKLKELKVHLMACHSASSLKQIKKIIQEGYYDMINIKLSRSGGMIGALKIIEILRKERIYFQIGCNLGESGILSAAGRALCLLNKDAKYYDGSFDPFILKKNITDEHVSFGFNGEAGPLGGYGLGVNVSPGHLMRLSNGPAAITIVHP